MSKKLITDELIDERLKLKGWDEDRQNDEEYTYDFVLKHYVVDLTDTWEDHCQYYIYEESTTDGYSVWIATEDPNRISINEDVHYYDSELSNCLKEAIQYNEETLIYVEDLNGDYVRDAIEELCDVIVDELITEITNELINEGYVEN